MALSKTQQLVMNSTDKKCGMCLKVLPTNLAPRFQLAHIHSESRGGPRNFWNLIPACLNCNSSDRELGRRHVAPHHAEAAFYFWTFKSQRQDVALKVALYRAYEILCIQSDINETSASEAKRLVYHALWSARSCGYTQSIALLTNLWESILPSGVTPQNGEAVFEDRIHRLDGHFTPELRVQLTEGTNKALLHRRRHTLYWRLTQDPSTSSKLLDYLQDGSPPNIKGEQGFQYEARKADLFLRGKTSTLLRSLITGDRKSANEAIDAIVHSPHIEAGEACSYTFQRLHPLLLLAKEKLKRADVHGALQYSRHFGSRGQARKLTIPTSVNSTPILKPALSGNDPMLRFTPIPGSYAERFTKLRRYIRESNLLEVVTAIATGFSGKLISPSDYS